MFRDNFGRYITGTATCKFCGGVILHNEGIYSNGSSYCNGTCYLRDSLKSHLGKEHIILYEEKKVYGKWFM